MDDIFVSGLDLALERGFASYSDWITKTSKLNRRRGLVRYAWTGHVDGTAKPVRAFIDFERWVGKCPDPNCAGLELVCLDEPVFFCLSCGNALIGGHGYPVQFPSVEMREALYEELLRRPVRRPSGLPRSRAAFMAQAVVPGLGRSWLPDESIDDLVAQRIRFGLVDSVPSDGLPERKQSRLRSRQLSNGARDFTDGELS